MKLFTLGPIVAKAIRFATGLRGGDPLTRYFGRVLAAHFFFFLVIYLSFFLEDRDFFRKAKRHKVIQSSIKVDVVAMPKLTLRELKQMGIQDIKVKSDSSKQGDKGALQRKSNTSLSFLKKIKQFSKKKLKVRRSGRKKKRADSQDEKLGKLILAGNKLSSGVSLTGHVNSNELSELRLYMESLPRFIRPHWVLPSYLKEKGLQCRVRIFIAKGGRLLQAKVVESSGDPQYDSYALRAIQKAQLPVPKDELLEELVQGMVVLGFPL